jgi:hypothetical protein
VRADKGFWFLLDALEELPDAWSRRLSVTIAASISDHGAVERLGTMSHRFRAIVPRHEPAEGRAALAAE